MFRNFKIAQIFLSAGVIAAALPLAAAAAETRTALVHAADLNLASESGRAMLRDRVNTAVHKVCDVTGWGFDLAAERASAACSRKALAIAMPQVDVLVQAARANQVAANQSVSVSSR
jgi:UrcA family protein